jgi:hypothetical protein
MQKMLFHLPPSAIWGMIFPVAAEIRMNTAAGQNRRIAPPSCGYVIMLELFTGTTQR